MYPTKECKAKLHVIEMVQFLKIPNIIALHACKRYLCEKLWKWTQKSHIASFRSIQQLFRPYNTAFFLFNSLFVRSIGRLTKKTIQWFTQRIKPKSRSQLKKGKKHCFLFFFSNCHFTYVTISYICVFQSFMILELLTTTLQYWWTTNCYYFVQYYCAFYSYVFYWYLLIILFLLLLSFGILHGLCIHVATSYFLIC